MDFVARYNMRFLFFHAGLFFTNNYVGFTSGSPSKVERRDRNFIKEYLHIKETESNR